jgi:serine protease AprX
MATANVLVEVVREQRGAFELHGSAMETTTETVRQGESVVGDLTGYGLEVTDEIAPVPMFPDRVVYEEDNGLAAFGSEETNPDVTASSTVVSAQVERSRLEELAAQENVTVWPNSELSLLGECDCEDGYSVSELAEHPFDLTMFAGGVDCRPYKPAVDIGVIRKLLGVDSIWREGFHGQNIVVGILDEGINGRIYPVIKRLSHRDVPRLPGGAPIDSHGSMCAADVLVAAPAAKLYDYPFLGIPKSGGALAMFQAVLDQRRQDGTPHLTNNSYGFVGRPPQEQEPNHEIWDINHPLHRKVREVIASGAPAFYAAGNCGGPCPSLNCDPSGIGPGQSIHASNSLAEVITVAAVNSQHQRVGYSAQGPGGFEKNKPDVASYSHFFGNFGPGRPADGDASSFDNGTSAATPVAAGVGALLMSAFPDLGPDRLKQALIAGTINLGTPGWDTDTGSGVINAASSYALLKRGDA